MAHKIARRADVAPFIVMDVMRAAAARDAGAKGPADRAIHLEVGQPGTPAPVLVREAAKRALDSDKLGYTLALGIPELRQAIARHYREANGLALDWERVCVTVGSSGAFLLAFLAAFDAGDRVALADPGYPAYRNILKALDCAPVGLAAEATTRFQPSPDSLDPSLAGLIVASPANPTGSMLAPGALGALVRGCRAKGIRLVSEEIYHGIVYEGRSETALAHGDDMFVVNSFSKYFSMTGWRLGWLVVPPDMVRAVERLAQNLFISPPTLAQHAAVAAFGAREELEGHVRGYRANRDFLLGELPKAGFRDFAPPDGAFYLYCDVGHMTNDSAEFCRRMLDEAGVAATPGKDFDPARGHWTLRFSFAGTMDDMREAAARLRAWRR
ncbi:MAG: aminotransferase class I/II-fold pyridoxal phosphate-dependent enzyme [Tagaea sp.]